MTFFIEHFVQQALPLSLCLVLFSLKCRQCHSQTSMEECLQNVNSVECYANQKCYSSTSKYHGNLQFYNKGCVDECDAIKICGPPNKCKVSNLCEIKAFKMSSTDNLLLTLDAGRLDIFFQNLCIKK